jgi:hypothetical protein
MADLGFTIAIWVHPVRMGAIHEVLYPLPSSPKSPARRIATLLDVLESNRKPIPRARKIQDNLAFLDRDR